MQALIVSRSALMHSSLALSDRSLQTLDSMIATGSRRNLRLPLELLILIRAQLLACLTNTLVLRSWSALQRYETSLRYLLCPDCRGYNQFVYGADVWEWEHFSGACTCSSTKCPSISSPMSLWQMTHHLPSLNPTPIITPSAIDPKRFAGRQQWLEFFLSKKALRVKRAPDSIIAQRRVIWDLVSDVLDGYGCYTESVCSREDIVVVPHRRAAAEEELEVSVILNRVERDMSLSADHKFFLYSASPVQLSLEHRISGATATFGFFDTRGIAHTIHTVFVAALSLPLTLFMLILAIFYFYRRPRAFRMF
ncbi:hypothetical protein D9757_002291 [Collybiopsis confluens]|uniref:Uncharacterized protein n=1 Tax=Collybiopsis confluens TaxID=2823264 RepID=A0A8H5I020_9AGAR|nr:hypothetical protein D9757_002291 [Collybiopsis confluens]